MVIPAQPARVPVSGCTSRRHACYSPQAALQALFSFCAFLLAPSRRQSCSPAIVLGEFFSFGGYLVALGNDRIATLTHAVPIWCPTPLRPLVFPKINDSGILYMMLVVPPLCYFLPLCFIRDCQLGSRLHIMNCQDVDEVVKRSSGVLGNSLQEYGCKWTFMAYHRARVPLGPLYMISSILWIPQLLHSQGRIRQHGRLTQSPIRQDGESEEADLCSLPSSDLLPLVASHRWLHLPFFPESPSTAILLLLAEEQHHSTD